MGVRCSFLRIRRLSGTAGLMAPWGLLVQPLHVLGTPSSTYFVEVRQIVDQSNAGYPASSNRRGSQRPAAFPELID
ncbi:hypothetical protein C8T65DRAFT_305276 [Cerioporus squamosus]|nr:hypothetical protein C8T65DRAFT_305276 [Cerioporus squamosus]